MELKLPDELAMNISFSIEFAEKEAERKRAEESLNGSELPVFLSTTIINDNQSKPFGLIGVAADITERKRVEKELIKANKNKTGNIVVSVKDTGIGISKEFISKIFEQFTQEEQGYTRTFEGNGLGLSLVKKYCEINNATIEVESDKNAGSTFRVIFKN